MYFVCFSVIFDNFALSPDLEFFALPLILRLDLWTPICLTIYPLLTWKMATSEKGCCVPGCGKDDTVSQSFPNPDKDMDQYLAWTQIIGIETTTSDPYYVYKNRRVCHDHFETKYLTWTRRLSPGALPTLLLPGSSRARAPLVEVTNQNVLLNTSLPSTSKDAALAHIVAMPLAETLSLRKTPKTVNENDKLIKMINKLQNKEANYATRLKRALNLSGNKLMQILSFYNCYRLRVLFHLIFYLSPYTN